MTDYEINVPSGVLSSLLSEKNGLAALVEAVLNQVLDAQATEQVGAQRYDAFRRTGRLSQRISAASDFYADRSTDVTRPAD